MSRRRKTKKANTILGYEKRYVYTFLIAGIILTLFGGTVFFSAFGVDTVWGADVQFDSIKYFDELYTSPEELPEYAFNVGSRTITADFDGKPLDFWERSTAPIYWTTAGISHNDEGMTPTINYDIGRFKYYSNLTEEISQATGYPIYYENNTADSHFYFGFSVGFSTAAYPIDTQVVDGRVIFIPEEGMPYAWYTEEIAECDEVSMTSTIAIRFTAISGNVTYSGTLNSVEVFRERPYYVTQTSDSGDTDIDTMNAEYNWNSREYFIPGYAESLGAPYILYDVIDSSTEKMATVQLGAKMRPALDPLIYDTANNPSQGFDGYQALSAVDVYNVGFIYDLVVDVSINGIPLNDPTATWLLGRVGITIPATPLLPWFNAEWVLILILILAILIGAKLKR